AADMRQRGRLLVEVDLKPGPAQRQRGGKPADPAADHGDLEFFAHHPCPGISYLIAPSPRLRSGRRLSSMLPRRIVLLLPWPRKPLDVTIASRRIGSKRPWRRRIGEKSMRARWVVAGVLPFLAVAMACIRADAAEARRFSFAYDQPHTTAYGIAADTFANKFAEVSHGTMAIDQFPGAQLGQEPQVLQKLRTGDVDFAITSTANSATLQPEAGVFSIHFVFRSEDPLRKELSD